MFYDPIWDYKEYALVRRPDTPNLYITWYKPGTQTLERLSTRTRDEQLARERLIEFATERELDTQPEKVPEPHEVLIDDVLSYYMDRKMGPERPSYESSKTALIAIRRFLDEHGLKTVADLQPDRLDLYGPWRNRLYRANQIRRMRSWEPYHDAGLSELERRVKPISDGTIRRELSILNAALGFFRKRNRITRTPFIQLPPAMPPRSRWLERDEFARLYQAAGSQLLRDYLLLAIHTLQRPRFIYDLRIEQVDLDRRRIEFLMPGARQTTKGRPAIRISEGLAPLLQRLMAVSVSGHVLEYDGKPIKTSLRRTFNIAVKNAGLDRPGVERICLYTLRHTGATWLAQEGVDLWQIAGMLGHRDTRMVERVYAKHHPDYQRRATEVLDRLVNVAGPRASSAPVVASGEETGDSDLGPIDSK